MSKAVTKVEMLVAMVVLVIGMAVIAATFPSGIRKSQTVDDRLLARVIAQNYAVALQARAAMYGLKVFRDNRNINLNHLEGATGGGEVAIRDAEQLPGGFDVVPVYDNGGLFHSEKENSNGGMLVRILYKRLNDKKNSGSIMFKISVKSKYRDEVYDFWTAISSN